MITPTAEHFRFLDHLRASGVTNMFGTAPYLEQAFGLDAKSAKTILLAWMKLKNTEAR